jgi:sec-independent protein translocase protein TatB
MLDVAWSEILVILLIAAVIIDPKDIPSIIKSLSKFAQSISKFRDEAKLLINDISKATELEDIKKDLISEGIIIHNNKKYTIDLEGNVQVMYDLKEINHNVSANNNYNLINLDTTDKKTIH